MDPNTIALLNTIGVWLAGVGTISAAIVALYLARREKRVRLKIYVGHRIIIGGGVRGRPEYCSIGITNVGYRPVVITNLGWKSGITRKKYAVQTIQPSPLCSDLPVKIADGESAKFMIPLMSDGSHPSWLIDFAGTFIGDNPKRDIRTLRLQVHTSIGKIFEARPEKTFREILLAVAMDKTDKSSQNKK